MEREKKKDDAKSVEMYVPTVSEIWDEKKK